MGLADFKNSIVTKDQFSQTFNKFDRSVQSSARGLDKMGGILSGGGLGMLFGGMAGVAGVAAIPKMLKLQLMQQTNTALAGASGDLATEMGAALPKLLEAGRAAALLNPSLGDANFMFQSLVTGIKRGSSALIDNTGITLKIGEATDAYAASIGKSVTELTAQERSIAILRGTLEGTLVTMYEGGALTQRKQTQNGMDGTKDDHRRGASTND